MCIESNRNDRLMMLPELFPEYGFDPFANKLVEQLFDRSEDKIISKLWVIGHSYYRENMWRYYGTPHCQDQFP